MKATHQSLAFWVGRLEEATRQIEMLEKMKSKPMKARLAKAKVARNDAIRMIAQFKG